MGGKRRSELEGRRALAKSEVSRKRSVATAPGRPVSESRATMTEVMTPQHANTLGNVFGGAVMSLMDRVAAVAAQRHARKPVVTVAVDSLTFLEPIHVGELVSAFASVNYVGKTSMEVGVRIEAEDLLTGVKRHTNSSYLTFVAVDEAGRPTPVNPVVPETDAEKRRHRAAARRRRLRLHLESRWR